MARHLQECGECGGLWVLQTPLGLLSRGPGSGWLAPQASGSHPPSFLPCREKLAWKALPGRLAPLALRGPPGSRGLMACEGSPARW